MLLQVPLFYRLLSDFEMGVWLSEYVRPYPDGQQQTLVGGSALPSCISQRERKAGDIVAQLRVGCPLTTATMVGRLSGGSSCDDPVTSSPID